MAVTIRQISERLGISYQTVADVLDPLEKRSSRYNPATRERIREMAKELGYKPNRAARAMVTGSFQAVSLLVSYAKGRSFLPTPMLDGILDECERSGLTLAVSRLESVLPLEPGAQPVPLREISSDGLLVNSSEPPSAELDALLRTQPLPVIWINAKTDFNAIFPDEAQAGRLAARHLIELGHRSAASFSVVQGKDVWPGMHYSFHERRLGFIEEFEREGLRCVDATEDRIESWGKSLSGLKSLLGRRGAPSAFFVQSPADAEALLSAASQLGLSIPGDISFVMLSDSDVRVMGLWASRVGTDRRALGEAAVKLLRKRIAAKGGSVPFERFHCHFKAAETSAPRGGSK